MLNGLNEAERCGQGIECKVKVVRKVVLCGLLVEPLVERMPLVHNLLWTLQLESSTSNPTIPVGPSHKESIERGPKRVADANIIIFVTHYPKTCRNQRALELQLEIVSRKRRRHTNRTPEIPSRVKLIIQIRQNLAIASWARNIDMHYKVGGGKGSRWYLKPIRHSRALQSGAINAWAQGRETGTWQTRDHRGEQLMTCMIYKHIVKTWGCIRKIQTDWKVWESGRRHRRGKRNNGKPQMKKWWWK